MSERQVPAVEKVMEILSRASTESSPFPPAELYSEGWMLRLVMESHVSGGGGLPIPAFPGSTWCSEARLASPFLPSRRGDPNGEGMTHADGVVGQFSIRPNTTAGFELSGSARLAVIEAKMGSKLAPGTSRVRCFDQAARNVAAMAWTIHQAGQTIADFTHLAFVVAVPAQQLDSEATFTRYTTKSSLASKVERRIDLYKQDDPTRHRNLLAFRHHTFEPFLEALEIHLWSWEESIASVGDPLTRDGLLDFYETCLMHSSINSRRSP